MTWEIVVSFCTVVVCSSALISGHWQKQSATQPAVSPDEFETMKIGFADLVSRVHKTQSEHEAVVKLAEETKKMLSNANLGKAFGGPRA